MELRWRERRERWGGKDFDELIEIEEEVAEDESGPEDEPVDVDLEDEPDDDQ